MKLTKIFRWMYYMRQGYHAYFAFVLTGINTLTVTYFLAIEKAPFLQVVFPTFPIYAGIMLAIGIPLLTIIGYIHWRKVAGHRAEAELAVENNPYVYKLAPGFLKNVNMPYYLLQSKILMKIAQNEKITEKEKNELESLQKKMEHLIKGGFVGTEGRTLSFGPDKKY